MPSGDRRLDKGVEVPVVSVVLSEGVANPGVVVAVVVGGGGGEAAPEVLSTAVDT